MDEVPRVSIVCGLSPIIALTDFPGILQVRRYFDWQVSMADVIYDVGADLSQGFTMIDLNTHTFPAGLEKSFFELKTSLILKARQIEGDGSGKI